MKLTSRYFSTNPALQFKVCAVINHSYSVLCDVVPIFSVFRKRIVFTVRFSYETLLSHTRKMGNPHNLLCSIHTYRSVHLLKLPVRWHGHGPVELVPKGLGEHLVDGHFAALAPGHRDARVHVVDLTGAQGYLLVLVAVADVHLELA